MAEFCSESAALAKKIVATVGKKIVIGTPIGIGKPTKFLNAIYQLASEDPSIELTIITGLTLSRPRFKSELEKRFLEPIMDRLIGDYENLLYEIDRERQTVPNNIKIIEFFLTPAKYLGNAYVQQNYISSSYTDILRDSFIQSMNIIAQSVAFDEKTNRYSTSCSADLFCDGVRLLQQKKEPIAVIGEVNQHLPFMHGEASVASDTFTHLLDTKNHRHLFALPRESLSWQDHMIGLYTSMLIKDDGCLQMGIGKLSNAVTYSLLLRDKHNNVYQQMLNELRVQKQFSKTLNDIGDIGCFQKGLYASTEMLCDGYIYLYQQNILKKRVYDHAGLQKLLNEGLLTEKITADYLQILLQHQIIQSPVTEADLNFLQRFGILSDEFTKDKIVGALTCEALQPYLSQQLKEGKIIHAGFFVGSNAFYSALHGLSEAERQTIHMVSIQRTNGLLWSSELAQQQRINARFVNTCMMVTLGGELVSDCLTNYQEISGVGGQYDFVCMASKIPSARSIITCRSTRALHGEIKSNIVWEHTNITIPRYLRDIVVTEYGIADCRGKTDSEVMAAILQVTDSRFQSDLIKQAKLKRKLPEDYELPEAFRHNYPATQKAFLSKWQIEGYFTDYPFGCDLTEDELILEKALQSMKRLKGWMFIKSLLLAMMNRDNAAIYNKYLQRMGLSTPTTLKAWCYKKLLQHNIKPHLVKKRTDACLQS